MLYKNKIQGNKIKKNNNIQIEYILTFDVSK